MLKKGTILLALLAVIFCGLTVAVQPAQARKVLAGRQLSGLEEKQEALRENLESDLAVMREERKAISRAGKKAEGVADEAEDIADKWRDIQVALLELYNVEPAKMETDDDTFFQNKVNEIRDHLGVIISTAREAATKMQESVDAANEAADAFVDSDLQTEEGDLGVVAEVEDAEQEIAEIAQKTVEEGEEIGDEAQDIVEAAENAKDQLEDFVDEVTEGDSEKIKDALETLQQTAEDETEMAEQLEDDASLVASEAEQAALRAETEKQSVIVEADNLGIDLQQSRRQ